MPRESFGTPIESESLLANNEFHVTFEKKKKNVKVDP